MEVKMVQCPNGHYYNSAIHASCPECGAAGSANSAGGIGHTIDANGAAFSGGAAYAPQSNIGKTVAAGSWSSAPGVTIPVTPGPSDSEIGSFRHTEIGGSDSVGTVVPEPVVGWLVCIEGPVKGCDYRIHAGYNYIGRETGDIHISGDMQISRQNHAMIAYDSVDRAFYFGPSGGRNLVRVNGKTVLSALEIHSYDVITIGTSQMMFIALCGERFDWNAEGSDNNG